MTIDYNHPDEWKQKISFISHSMNFPNRTTEGGMEHETHKHFHFSTYILYEAEWMNSKNKKSDNKNP